MAERAVVLMSVYAREDPAHLDAALASVANQTRRPDKIVLVQDGPLGADLVQVIEKYRDSLGPLFETVALPTNQGLTRALNEGLQHCDGEFVLRMDSDDISPLDRFAKQLAYMAANPQIAVLGTAMLEFEESPEKPVRIKPVVAEHDAIAQRMPWRNPINHATCCYRTATVRQAGGYPELRFLEDYFLWAILLCRGARFHNLEEPLYLCRFDRQTLHRRAGWLNFRNECYLRWFLWRNARSGFMTLLAGCTMQLVLRLTPLGLRERLWNASRRSLD